MIERHWRLSTLTNIFNTTADGLEGFRARLEALPRGAAKINTVRVFQDGNFVFAHTEYNIGGPRVGFDIFRFEGTDCLCSGQLW